MAITKVTTPEIIDLPTTISSVETNTDGVVLPKGSTIAQNLIVDYLVIAGGGGGGANNAGGGGAGGYLTSYDSDPSGDNSATLTALSLSTGVSGYTVTVGAGGGGTSTEFDNGTRGENSEISGSGITTLTAYGGGCGRASGGAAPGNVNGGSGGGGGHSGSASIQDGGSGIALQGGDGGNGIIGSPYNGGGGGGASGNASGINGANGLVSTIDGGTTTRAGGGGGGQDGGSRSSGGNGGGGAGGNSSPTNGDSGGLNTGSGGGGGGSVNTMSGTGGSGIIILRYPNIFTATYTDVTGGAAGTETAIGTSDKYIIITAGTGTVTFSGTPTVGRPVTGGSYILEDGEFRYNTTDKKVEYYDGADWFTLTSTTAVPQAGTTGICNYPTTASALYQFNDDVTDTCNNYDGIAYNLNPYVTGKFGNAADFNGTTSRVDITSPIGNSASNENDDFSVSLWVNWDVITGTAAGFNGAMIGNSTGSTYSSFALYSYGNAAGISVAFERYFNNTGYYNSSYLTAAPFAGVVGTWYNLVFTYVGSSRTVTTYVDGTALPTYTLDVNAGSRTMSSINSFGSYNGSTYGLDGQLDQVRIFPSALTSAQVTALYEETAP